MKMAIVPSYADIFDEPIPDLANLLKDISSEIIIGLLAMVQAKLHLSKSDFTVQKEVLRLFIQRQPFDIQMAVISRIGVIREKKGEDGFAIFSMLPVLDFMHYALANYKEVQMGEDTTPDQEYRLFKAYFIFIELRQDKDKRIFDENRGIPGDFFYRNTWPMMSGQFEAEHLVNPITEMVRGIVLFNFLEYESPYAENVRSFLDERGQASSWNYVLALLDIIQDFWKRSENGSTYSFSIDQIGKFETLFSTIAINVDEYKANYSADHRNYSGIKDKPLFRYGSDRYLILNWNFFYNKLYEGLLFDLYSYSGIGSLPAFKTFPNFKQYVSEEITEGFLFRKLLGAALQKKYSVLLFDDRTRQGLPDGYYRFSNNVILFEIKDAYFPAKAINTTSYKTIKDAIDTKFNQVNKGTGQLISQLKQMTTRAFESPQGYKRVQNLTLYPVMVYTDHFFSMPGINNYLQEEFEQKLNDSNLRTNFKKIQPLVFVDVRFLINHLDLLRGEKTGLIELFNEFYKEQVRTKKKVKRTDDLNAFFDCYKTFEASVKDRYGNILYNREKFVRTIVDVLELTQGLPIDQTE